MSAPKLEAIINFIDIDSKNYIDFTDLSEFFKKRYFFPYEEELISILKRIDTNDDGILESDDFFLLFQFIEKKIKSNQNDVTMTKNRMENFENANTRKSFRNQENKITPKKRLGNFQIRKSISPLKGQNLGGSGKKDVVKLENYPIFKNYKERRALEASNNTTIEKITDQREYHIKVRKENYGKLSERFDFKNQKEKSLNENNLDCSQLKTAKANEQKTKEHKKLYGKKIIENDNNEEDVNFRKKYIKNDQLSNELDIVKIEKTTENSYSFSKDLKLQEKARNFLNNFVCFDKKLEIKKTDLVLRPDFNIVDLFSFFDSDSKGFLIKDNFDSFFCKNSVNVDTKQLVFLLFRKYDKNDLGILRFSEFTDFFCPHSEELVKFINKRKPINHDSKFTYEEVNSFAFK